MEFTKGQRKTLDRAIKVWGEHQQVIKAIEEMAELQQVLCKWLNIGVQVRKGVDPQVIVQQIQEETADATIMLEQLRTLFDGDGDEILIAARDKINRLVEYLPPLVEEAREVDGSQKDHLNSDSGVRR